MNDPVAFTVASFPLDMHPNSDALDTQWIQFFAGLEGPCRIFSQTTRFDLKRPRQQMQQLLKPLDHAARVFAPIAACVDAWQPDAPQILRTLVRACDTEAQTLIAQLVPDARWHDPAAWSHALRILARPLWLRRWRQDYARMYHMLTEQLELRGLQHRVLCWLPDGVKADQQAALMSRMFDTGVQIGQLLPLIRDTYEEMPLYLAPKDSSLPLITLLSAVDLRGTWNLSTLRRVLDMDADIHLMIDVVPQDRVRAEMDIDFKAVSIENNLRDSTNPRDVKAERQLETAKYYQEQAEFGFHAIRMVIAIEGRDTAMLDDISRQVIRSLSSHVRFVRPKYGQGPLAQFFGPTPTKQIDSFAPARMETSHGVSVMLPFGIRRPSRTDGMMWMIEGQTPIMFNPMVDAQGRKRAGHAVVLGKTGSGKTLSSFVWANRMLALGWQVVFFEPQGHAKRFIASCGAGGAYYKLDMRKTINILDVVVARDAEGNPPALGSQILQVLNQLRMLLGSTVSGAAGEQVFRGREFTNRELALIDMALQRLYAPWKEDLDVLTSADTPTLGDLCAELRTMPVRETMIQERSHLLDEMELYLIEGSAGATYNGRTSVTWNFENDATAYDLTALEPGAPRVLSTAQAFGALNRYVRNRPNRNRPLVVFFDEFAYTLGQAPQLARFAADAAKTWRTFGAALFTLDQDAHTYLGTEGSVAEGTLRSVFDNAPLKIIMKQDPEPARRLVDVVDGLQPSHAQAIMGAGLGDCIIAWNSDDNTRSISEVFVGRVIPTDMELRAFSGT